MEIWSVQLENNSWNDDTFNGTFDECLEYCDGMGYEIGAGCRLGRILVKDTTCVETLEIVEDID